MTWTEILSYDKVSEAIAVELAKSGNLLETLTERIAGVFCWNPKHCAFLYVSSGRGPGALGLKSCAVRKTFLSSLLSTQVGPRPQIICLSNDVIASASLSDWLVATVSDTLA